jgi:hypothetical protein
MIVPTARFAQYQPPRHTQSVCYEHGRGEAQQANFAMSRDAGQDFTRTKSSQVAVQKLPGLRR